MRVLCVRIQGLLEANSHPLVKLSLYQMDKVAGPQILSGAEPALKMSADWMLYDWLNKCSQVVGDLNAGNNCHFIVETEHVA